MQRDGSHSTMPYFPFVSALKGHPETHAGSRQCMHCFLTNDVVSPSRASMMMFLVWALRSVGICHRPPLRRVSGINPLAVVHAATQALQPMQTVASYSMATASVRGLGLGELAIASTAV